MFGTKWDHPDLQAGVLMRVAIYARVSTNDQDVGLQLDELRAAAAGRGWTVLSEFTDVGARLGALRHVGQTAAGRAMRSGSERSLRQDTRRRQATA